MNKFIGFALILLLVSCSTNTVVLDSWKDPNTSVQQEHFKKVSVIALVKNELIRQRIEDRYAEINPVFHTSYPFLNNKTAIDKEMLIKLLKSEDYDGVVTMRLVDTKKETDYVQGNTMPYYGYYPYAGYGTLFGGWYYTYSPYYYSPGYYVENTYYIVETNVFSLKENKLIWSAITKTQQFTDIENGLNDIIQALVNQMKKDGSIKLED